MALLNRNQDQINKLRQVIFDNLDDKITQDYCLLDIPDHNNIGDNLIWAGELAFLKRFEHTCTYTANLFLCQFNKIPKKGLILLHGGGNFGDMWRVLQDFRLKVVAEFPESKIVILPQTVHYKDEHLLIQDAKEFNKHPDLTICARDTVSYEILSKYFTNNKILLVPDMAFCLDFSSELLEQTESKILYLKRNDRELNVSKDEALITSLIRKKYENEKIDVKDWPTINGKTDLIYRYYFKIDGIISKRLIKVPILKGLVDHRYGIKRRDNMENYIRIGVEFINQYKEIYSTRLHVFILGTLLNKPVNILDNSYGKNLNFYNTWLKDFQEVTMIK